MPKAVCVTGMGIVSGASTKENFFSHIFDQRTLHRLIPLANQQQLSFSKAALSVLPDELPKLPHGGLQRMDKFSQYAVSAAGVAINQSQVMTRDLDPARIGVIVGTSNAGVASMQSAFSKIQIDRRKPHPFTIPKVMGNSAASCISAMIGARGPVFGITSACASGTHAIGLGYFFINSGMLDICIVGGADACDTYEYLKAWDAMGVVSNEICKPFDKDRSGLSIGDGSAILVLESDVISAGTKRLANLSGFSMLSDGSNNTAPALEGMVSSMKSAMDSAGVDNDQLGYINAHGTGTNLNDACEAKAIVELFGSIEHQPVISSTKPIHGHAMGATGAIEAAICIEALNRKVVPGTFGLSQLDQNCAINLATKPVSIPSLKYVLSNSFAFGGINSSLLFEASVMEI